MNRYMFERTVSYVISNEVREVQFVDATDLVEAVDKLEDSNWDEVHTEEVAKSKPIILDHVSLESVSELP